MNSAASPLKKTKREKVITLMINTQVSAKLKQKDKALTGEEATCNEAKAFIMSLVKQVDKIAKVGSEMSVANPKAMPDGFDKSHF